MGRRWEYAQVWSSRDPGADDWTPKTWLWLPGQTAWEEVEVENLVELLTTLGADGWEMVGMPSTQEAVFTYQAANDTWHDRSYWVERTFWFKRLVAE